jgi:steroid delta-isomerase-like uncharacterized protein
MASQDNTQLIRDLYKAFDQGDHARGLSFLSPNAEFKVIGMEPMRGMQAIREGMEDWSKTFPDMKSELTNVIGSGDFVVVKNINRGTHQGPLVGPKGSLPATGRKIELPACDVFKVQNGKVVSWTCYWPTDLMLEQLGFGQSRAAA